MLLYTQEGLGFLSVVLRTAPRPQAYCAVSTTELHFQPLHHFDTGLYCVGHAGLELTILLPLSTGGILGRCHHACLASYC